MAKANGSPALLLPPIADPRLVKAYSHPTRVQILSILAATEASQRMLATEIDEPPNNVGYHIKVLKRLGCIEVVKTESVRGGRVQEIFYRATRQPLLHLDAWQKLSDPEKHDWVETVLRLATKNIADSMGKGLFLEPDDGHMSRTPLTVDLQAWAEVTGILDRAAEDIFEVHARAADRLAEGASEGFHVKVVILQFQHQDPF